MRSAVIFLLFLISASFFVATPCSAKMVFAHYMLWVPATSDSVQGFMTDIQLAQSVGIDGFAINTADWSAVSWAIPRADQIYQAAQNLNSGFKLFFSADMTNSLPGLPGDVVNMVQRYANHPNQLKINGQPFLSTFVGQDTSFGYGSAAQGWQAAVLQPLQNMGLAPYFVPYFGIWPAAPAGQIALPQPNDIVNLVNKFPFVNGLFSWLAWPFFNGDLQTVSNGVYTNYQNTLSSMGKSFMAPVSPWFSKHTTGPDYTNPNQVYGNYRGPGMWIQEWQYVVETQPDFVEIMTFNDYAERHYVGPTTAPWGVGDYNDTSFPHLAFLDMASYYISSYKAGNWQAVPSDKLYLFYRPHSKNAVANSDPIPRPANVQAFDDNVYAYVGATAPGVVTINSGYTQQTFNVTKAGWYVYSMPFQEGQQSATFSRNNQQLINVVGQLYISNNINHYEFNCYSNFGHA